MGDYYISPSMTGDYYFSLSLMRDNYVSPSLMGGLLFLYFTDEEQLCLSFTDGGTIMSLLH
jgi:hypothetical protein